MMQSKPFRFRHVMALIAAVTLSGLSLSLDTKAHASDIDGSFPELAVNTGSLRGSFIYPTVARLGGMTGRFVLAMGLHFSPGDKNNGTYFQIYSPQGAPLGTLTQVNPMNWLQDPPSVAATGDGFVVVSSNGNILGQRFSTSGNKLGVEFRINTTAASQYHLIGQAKVAGLADGGFVVVWASRPWTMAQGVGEIYAQRYDNKGRAAGGEFIVNTTRSGQQGSPAVAGLSNGGFVVAWVSPASDGHTDVYTQRYAANGARVGKESNLTSAVDTSVLEPVIAGLNRGGFVAACIEASTGDVYGQRFTGAGLPNGPEFRVDGRTSAMEPITLSVFNNDRFLIAYGKQRDEMNTDIYARVYDRNPARGEQPEFPVNTVAEWGAKRIRPAAIALSGNNLFTAWERWPTGKLSQVRLRRLVIPAK